MSESGSIRLWEKAVRKVGVPSRSVIACCSTMAWTEEVERCAQLAAWSLVPSLFSAWLDSKAMLW